MNIMEYWRMFRPRSRLVRGMLLGVLVAFGLAFAYVYGGGMALLGNSQFTTIDGYAFTIALMIGSLVPLGYWLYFRDVSEAVAIFATIIYSLYFGLEDIMVYALLPNTSVPEVLPWLNDSAVGTVAALLGYNSVSREALYAVVLLTGVLLLVFVKTLDSFEKKFLGVEV